MEGIECDNCTKEFPTLLQVTKAVYDDSSNIVKKKELWCFLCVYDGMRELFKDREKAMPRPPPYDQGQDNS